MRRPAHLVALPLLALLLVACSAGGSDSASGSDGPGDDAAAPAAGVGSRAESAGSTGGTSGGGGGAPDRARVTAVERAVVRTATLVVEVDDVRKAADSARAVAQGAGGELAAEQSASGTDRDDEARSVLTLRVPGTTLDATVTRLAELGRERERGVASEDVTEQLIDLDSRVATQRASVARVRALLERAKGLGDVVKIEGELAKREAELESLTARMRGVEDRVAMSTVTLTLVGDGSALPSDPEEQVGFTGGLRGGWEAFTATARVVAATTGALLPFLPFLLLAAWAARRWVARGSVVSPAVDSRA